MCISLLHLLLISALVNSTLGYDCCFVNGTSYVLLCQHFCQFHNQEIGREAHVPLSTHDMLLLFMNLPQIESQCAIICKIIRIYLCFTVTTATCERGFSVLKLIKTSLRTNLSNAFLEILVTLLRLTLAHKDIVKQKLAVQPCLDLSYE